MADEPTPQLRRKKPCKECPWRRTSPRGWLGAGHEPSDFLNAAAGDGPISCHMSNVAAASRGKPEHRIACTGSLIFRRNIGKLPRDPATGELVRRMVRDTNTVFANATEFHQHHCVFNVP